MKHLFILTLAFVFVSSLSYSQNDTVFNQTNAQGLKHGFWKKYYPNGNLMYKGEFKDGKPVGQMIRYFKSGALQAIINYDKTGDYARTRIFYEDGEISAEGIFYKMLKDSTWKYYSYYSGTILSEENYVKGKKHGIQKTFYPNGKLSEEIEYKNEMKSGIWRQYYDDGTLKMSTTNNLNHINGKYIFNYPNGVLMMSGVFIDSKKNGTWIFYTDEGKEKYKLRYNMGKINPEDEEMLTEKDKEFFKQVEENIGKFEEPSIEDFYRGPQ